LNPLTVGGRGSALARWQVRWACQALEARHPGIDLQESVIETHGDVSSGPLDPLDRGVFVRTIQQALLDGAINVAVHSLKDLPSRTPDGLLLAAFPGRHPAEDLLIAGGSPDLTALPEGSRIGTGSPRRRFQLLHRRPDLQVEPLRGNVDTRLRSVTEGRLDGIVLARAGVERLGLALPGSHVLDPETMVPAAGQGALALEIRADDATTLERVSKLDCRETRMAVRCERACLESLDGGCMAPLAVHAWIAEERLHLMARAGSLDGRQVVHEEASMSCTTVDDPPRALAVAVADRLRSRGVESILEAARAAQLADLRDHG